MSDIFKPQREAVITAKPLSLKSPRCPFLQRISTACMVLEKLMKSKLHQLLDPKRLNQKIVCFCVLLGDDIPLIIHYESLQKPFLHSCNSVPPVNKTHLNKLNWKPGYIRTKPIPASPPCIMKVFTEDITLVLWSSHNAQCTSNSLPSKHTYIFIVWHAVK